ncbi:nitrite/sulfite reductase [Magnetospirillum aberrantis]|uniref:Nitrite/sulfite reductase n=1 Tax=Magnetospirillum aberrantis SpK TaxID=908842 RepID=A0A7C9UYZ3_9PROT|nr:nitrite/sulfite reductase [Magnetospirillum aberrantis]NFV80133.1 nitrite/sulfite reductase [Magnetospirillum aberrantis SpK]
MLDASPVQPSHSEPLVRLSDLDEYRQGLEKHLDGQWDDERWTAYRVRFGVYGQKQPGVQMVRIKIPGGILPIAWARTIAQANRRFAVGDAHFTTRQDVQIYHVPLARSADLLEFLYSNGVTTREACGNTLRNMNACALAGACPRELVDAGRVAEQLARAWIRHPLVQHMPRKAKFTVSGCATDCGASSIHDLGFIAVERDGQPGFRVLAGGGLGGQPRAAVEVLPFVTEAELPTVVEAFARLHQKYSNRRDRSLARIKFVVKRFGEEKFVALFQEEFERVKGLPQRPWAPLSWRRASEAAVARSPVGVVDAHDGTKAVVVSVPLGIVSSDQLERLADIADQAGARELRITRDQNVALLGVAGDKVALVAAAVRAIGFDVPASAEAVPDVVSCPGTTTCRIGITNSQNFAREALAQANSDPAAKGLSLHVSGCQNSCGLHHVADFGLHGMAKKIDGRSAPHYQLHFGGDARTGEIALSGPIVPAKLADRALSLLRSAYASARAEGESVRAWAERQGKAGLGAVLAPLDPDQADAVFVDWGDAADFAGAPTTRGECAAPFAMDDLFADLADDALISLDRYQAVGQEDAARAAGRVGVLYAARRVLHAQAVPTDDDITLDAALASVRGTFGGNADLLAAFAAAEASWGGILATFREALAVLIDTVREVVEAPPVVAEAAAVGDLSAILGMGE